jgi:hypothetical protein
LALFVRSETPPQFDNYADYLPFLRRDFRHTCAYCERTELRLGGQDFFEIDHFRPRRQFPELQTQYSNLYYVCGKCNRHKAGVWPSADLIEQGFRFADPCQEDMYLDHLRVEPKSGELRSLTNCGKYSCLQIRLNRPDLREWRRVRRLVSEKVQQWEGIASQLDLLLNNQADPDKRNDIRVQIEAIRWDIVRSREMYSF